MQKRSTHTKGVSKQRRSNHTRTRILTQRAQTWLPSCQVFDSRRA